VNCKHAVQFRNASIYMIHYMLVTCFAEQRTYTTGHTTCICYGHLGADLISDSVASLTPVVTNTHQARI
jgi:hypothetical protein